MSSAASSRSRSGTFPSPGTPGGGAAVAGYQKGWSSERVPLPGHGNRRYGGGGGGVYLPFNNGRALPSKWEDAERWICSPVSGDGSGRSSVHPAHLRRPKSKSGPLGTLGGGTTAAYSSASPLVPCFDGGKVGHFMASSPFLAGVLMPERRHCANVSSARGGGTGKVGRDAGGVGGGGGSLVLANGEPYIVRSASIHGWSDAIESSSSLPSSQDEKSQGSREAATEILPSEYKKDAATQMSSDESTPASSSNRLSFSTPQLAHPLAELDSHFSKLEIRDVQVDDQVTMTRWSKKQVARGFDRRSASIIESKKNTAESNSSAWEITETIKSISKYEREEAKITAWENLQRAKAEAEIRKLEMKLEKKRSSSMDKILSKLRSAEKKGHEMRKSANARPTKQVLNTPKKGSFLKGSQISSLAGCFTCPAF